MPSLFIINIQYAFHALTADMGVFVQFSEGRRAQGRKEDDDTQNMAYGLAMATTLTTNGMSGDFPSVYINHHGNSFSMCVGTQFIVCKQGSMCSWSSSVVNQ